MTTKNNIQALILDMDGVIWRKKHPIGDLKKIFEKANALGLKYVFATNNSTETVESYVNLLTGFGIPVEKQQIFTSATATAQHLKKNFPDGGNIFMIGQEGLTLTLEAYGFTIDAENARAVVVGMDRHLTYEKMVTATLLIRSGVPFIGTNPDKTFPTPEGLVPGAGSMLAAIEAATDVPPQVIGKPKGTMFLQALEALNIAPENALVVGDRLETDIAGGQAAGCNTALVLSGVATEAEGKAWQPAIDFIAEDLDTLITQLGS
ncbi:HAD-IIA family hydrolase [bacterium]|nr:HAD-IIA family hydrolase [bacterium]